VNAERELLVAPELFYALHESLPRVSGIEALWKRGDYDNELSRFRYDVTIHVGPRPRNEMATMELRYGDPVPAASSGLPDVLILTGAPNPRVSRFVSALELLDAGREDVRRLRDVVTDDARPLQIPPGYELRASRVSAAGEARCDLICARVGADLDWHSAALVSPRGSSSARHTNTPAFSWSNAELGNRLRQLLMSRLPNYMVPQAFVFVDSMPQTPNGKLDRKALQAIGVAPDEAVYVGPRNVLEEQLCAAFAEVLGVARIGIHDSFFELGGHSLLAARLANRLHRALGRDVPLRTLFQAPTVARLSEILGAPTIADERGNEPVLVPLNVRALSDRDDEVVVFLPSLGGEVTPYRELALHIENRSVFALRSPLLEGAPAPADRAELVMGYASAIRRSFDGRDVCIVGWSAGGVLCHAVAAHLRRNASTVVTRVVLLDSSVLERRSDIASARIAAIHALTIAGATEWIEAAMAAPESELPSLICRGLGLSGGGGVAYAERYIRTFEVHSSLLAGYQPEPLDVPVSLLTCSDTPDLRWNAFAPVRVAGNHFSLLSAEHARSTAAALSRIIQPSSAGSSHRRFEVITP
jgi:thioesterase domain-containing protein